MRISELKRHLDKIEREHGDLWVEDTKGVMLRREDIKLVGDPSSNNPDEIVAIHFTEAS